MNAKQSVGGQPEDVCVCGDYRRQHKDGNGPCIFNRFGADLNHGFQDCMSFRHQTSRDAARARRDEPLRLLDSKQEREG